MRQAVPTIVSVRLVIEQDRSLLVDFEDGRSVRVDLSNWIDSGGDSLAPLKSKNLFAKARIGEFGRSIEWGENEDLAIDAIHIETLGNASVASPRRTPARRSGGYRFEVYKDQQGDFRFRFVASNGEVVFGSEGYRARSAALKAIEAIRENSPGASIERLKH